MDFEKGTCEIKHMGNKIKLVSGGQIADAKMCEAIYEELKANTPKRLISGLYQIEMVGLHPVKRERPNSRLEAISCHYQFSNQFRDLKIGWNCIQSKLGDEQCLKRGGLSRSWVAERVNFNPYVALEKKEGPGSSVRAPKGSVRVQLNYELLSTGARILATGGRWIEGTGDDKK